MVCIFVLILVISCGLQTTDDKGGGKKDNSSKITDISETPEEIIGEEDDVQGLNEDSSQQNSEKEKNSSNKKESGTKMDNENASVNSTEVTYKEPLEDNEEEQKTKPSKPEKTYAKISGGKITCDSFGRYSGQYVEDGRDELVDSVATVLVTNHSEEYLEYATLTFDVNGKAANFIVTGLPAGTSAWVMEANKLKIESGANFTYQDCASDFRDDVSIASESISLAADGGWLTATNISDKEMKNIVVYYRKLHEDGNYLGGVAYTAQMGDLKTGDSTEVLAGHYSAKDCEVVRVSWNDQ